MQHRSESRAEIVPEELRDLLPPLLSIAKTTRQLLYTKVAQIGLVFGQDHFLDVIPSEENISVCRLADKLNVRPSTVSKMVDRLFDQGFIVRETDSEDARRTLLRLTASGAVMQAKVREVWADLETDLADGLTKRDDVDVVGALSKMEAALNKRLARLR